MPMNQTVADVTARIVERSKPSRERYLDRMERQIAREPHRTALSCANLAHGFAACGVEAKAKLTGDVVPNLGIVTAYNDMLSAHQPFERFPNIIREAAAGAGGVAQVAGGVPAMCDGVTQGRAGMELSLFSRDVIAMATAVALSHDMFDSAVYLGVCDKIVPGLLIGALTFSYLPAVFVPAGPMTSGLPNDEKAKRRQLYAEGKIGRGELLEAESKSYHGPGTCTFYGTANSNQMMMELMGLHIPGSSFVNPGTPLRDALTISATRRALAITAQGNEFTPVGRMIDERSFVNAIVGLHATGGSTNHVLHLMSMAAAGGIVLKWDDLAALSDVTPLLARVYPNGLADVNHFHAAGGLGHLIGELLDGGLAHGDTQTVWGEGLDAYRVEAKLDGDGVGYERLNGVSGDPKVLAKIDAPFSKTGGLKMLEGNLGRAVAKVSAIPEERHVIEAPARVFHSQEALKEAFDGGDLNDQDFIAVVRFQGSKACGMPELHRLIPLLGVLQDRGAKVALVTDGRMSGASGKVPGAIHLTPEAADGGAIGRVQDGDPVRFDATNGRLEVLIDADEFAKRPQATADLSDHEWGMGRELFQVFRDNARLGEVGAGVL